MHLIIFGASAQPAKSPKKAYKLPQAKTLLLSLDCADSLCLYNLKSINGTWAKYVTPGAYHWLINPEKKYEHMYYELLLFNLLQAPHMRFSSVHKAMRDTLLADLTLHKGFILNATIEDTTWKKGEGHPSKYKYQYLSTQHPGVELLIQDYHDEFSGGDYANKIVMEMYTVTLIRKELDK